MAATIAASTTLPTSRRRALYSPISSGRLILRLPSSLAMSLRKDYCQSLRNQLTTISYPDSKVAAAAASIVSSNASSSFEKELPPFRRILLVAAIWIPLSFLSFFLACKASLAAGAAADSIRASGLGLKVAAALRSSGWTEQAIVFALATLPVIELRGAIPVGYWMHLDPLHLTALSVLGNMFPVPFIVLYLKKVTTFLSSKSESTSRLFDNLFERAREKAGPIEEFQWLGLMLFVAVPFPGTGAWTGAIVASIIDMPFWSAVSANFVGVVLAGLLVNLVVNLGLKYAILTGVLLFFVSTAMWSVLRQFKKAWSSK